MTASSHITALLTLLDDPDPVVQRSVRGRLLDIGPDVVAPLLRQLAQAPVDKYAADNALDILFRMGRERFRREIDIVTDVPKGADINLERGAFAVALLRYPELRISDYSDRLDVMATQLEQRLRESVDDIAIVRAINTYMTEDLGYHGVSQQKYYDPDNSCMNRVMDRRMGIPVTLSVVYLLLAGRLGLPLFGTNVPMRFLMKYRMPTEEVYIDAFGGGTILDHGDCRRFLRDLGFDYHPAYLAVASKRAIVARMMHNLVEIYRHNQPEVAEELDAAIEVVAEGRGE